MSNDSGGHLSGAFSRCRLDVLQVQFHRRVFMYEDVMMLYISDYNCVLPVA